MSSPSGPLGHRITALAAALDLAPAHLAALLLVASVACAGTVWLWLTARPDGDVTAAPAAAIAPTAPPIAPTTAASETPGVVVVHVSGAVRSAGVHELPAGARVVDAVNAAGGTRRGARTERLNLARPVRDGEQIHVPRAGEGDSGAVAASSATATGGEITGVDPVVDVNRGSPTELEALPGVGPVLAARIVAHRDEHGAFTSADDLLAVEGIGDKTLAALRDHVTVR